MPRPIVAIVVLVSLGLVVANSVSTWLGGPSIPELNSVLPSLIVACGIPSAASGAVAAVRAWRGTPEEKAEPGTAALDGQTTQQASPPDDPREARHARDP